jgi:predicted DNA-binding transcriptional regulator YafY
VSNYSQIRRFAIIVEEITNSRTPTLKYVLDRLHECGFEISERTLQRDIERLREDFNLEINYNTANNTYYIDADSSLCFDALLRLVQLFNTSDILWQSLHEKEQTLSFIAFEKNIEDSAGTQYLEPIYTAIHNCKQLTFEHENFEKQKISRHTIKPYLLKEYSNKWYVVGALPDNCIRIFGLDRIKNPTVEKTGFKAKERNAVTHLFDHTIGLVYDANKPEKVVLSVTAGQAKYFKRIPLHASQQTISEKKDEVVFSYFLAPNRELQRLILGYGAQVKVLQPAWFAQQVEDEVKTMLKKYKK